MKIREVITETMTRDELRQFEKDIEKTKQELSYAGIQNGFKQTIPTDEELAYRLEKAKQRIAKHNAREKKQASCLKNAVFWTKGSSRKTRQMAKRAEKKRG
jgi:ABC-type transport system involved in cytochrome c biogenesis ATPase subunit